MATSNTSVETVEKPWGPTKKQGWSLKRKLLVGGSVALILIIGLAVGLGVGLTRHRNSDSDSDSGNNGNDNSGSDNSTSSGNDTMYLNPWQPAVGTSWQYVLKWPLNSTLPNNTAVWDIDLFDNTKATIQGLQANKAKVICYFSAGSYEDWRPDANKFASADLGRELDGWPGERWVNVSSPSLRAIMLTRLDMAKDKGCNGVDPDNMDGYDNKNGLGLTQQQAIDYTIFLANAAHKRGLSIGLKNAGDIIPSVIKYMQWSVNEQCVQYNECDTYAAFIQANKPVFHVEYPKGTDTNNNVNVASDKSSGICGNAAAKGFSTIIKNMILDLWEQTCP